VRPFITAAHPGTTLAIELLRAGKHIAITMIAGEAPVPGR
jgi:hypothetical protein